VGVTSLLNKLTGNGDFRTPVYPGTGKTGGGSCSIAGKANRQRRGKETAKVKTGRPD